MIIDSAKSAGPETPPHWRKADWSEQMARREDMSILDAALSQPADRQTLAETVTGRLRELILDGQLPPGQPLRPNHLAPRLSVSVMPVREALRILEAEGLVSFTPRIGARVAEIGPGRWSRAASRPGPAAMWCPLTVAR